MRRGAPCAVCVKMLQPKGQGAMSKKLETTKPQLGRQTPAAIDHFRRRGFDAIADYFEQLHRPPFTISELVSIARALTPFAEQEGRRRQAHGATGPGAVPRRQLPGSRFKSREFVARCVGLAPKTLAKAEAVVEAADRDPRFRLHVMSLAATIRTAFERTEHGRAEWIEGTIELASTLANAREQFKSDNDFGHWLSEQNIVLGTTKRAALIGMGRNIELNSERSRKN